MIIIAENCEICRRIQLIQQNANPYLVKELQTGYVVLGDNQYFQGYTLFLCKQHQTELQFLDRETKDLFLHEMSLVSEAVYTAFGADKMNCELLGNGDAHLHWHLFPRKLNDTPIPGPVWWVDKDVMFSPANRPSPDQLATLKRQLSHALETVLQNDH